MMLRPAFDRMASSPEQRNIIQIHSTLSWESLCKDLQGAALEHLGMRRALKGRHWAEHWVAPSFV